MDGDALLEGLTDAQAAAVASDGAPLCILAGAGSGKTRVLTRRIAWRVATGSADPRHVLALTFTRKAAGELRTRLGQLGVRDGVAAGTFHAIAYAQLRQRWADSGEAPPALLERKAGFLARLVGPRSGRDAAVQPIDLAAKIEWAKARMIAPSQYEAAALTAGRTPPLSVSAMAALYERYEAEKRRRAMVDFDDLLLRCVQALRDDTAFAAAQRWRFRHLFVDEFQDVNPTQAALLAGWRGEGDDLCVVGDPNQAIYSWNGAEPAYLVDFTRREPGATVVRLDDNFRSSPQVLAVASTVLAGGGIRAELRPHRADGPLPTVRAYASDRDEARGVARAVRGKHRPGTPWSRIAVLARTNAQTVLLEEAFREAGIPFRVRGGGAFLQQPEVRTTLDRLRRSGGTLAARLVDLEVDARVDTDEDGPAAERRAVLAELVRLAREHLAVDANATVDSFLGWLTTAVGNDAGDTRADAVDLATFHAAKGLEWPIVFLVGLERGLVPIGHAKTDAGVDEERRLLYVAITRAEEELHCSWARERTFGSRSVPRQPSPWLDDIQAARAALSGGGPTTDLRDRVAAERRKLRSADGGSSARRGNVTIGANADPGVLTALKAWRSAAARAAGVPAFVIFHDTTLAAVAEAQPSTRASLLQLPGLGPVKAERYGDDLLRVVAEHRAS